ncbi:MAG: hypothetical protein B7Z02_17780, partial [Rhodobacterales bacterium 32-67-9]
MDNTATASGTAANGTSVTDTGTASVGIARAPGLSLVKTVSSVTSGDGDAFVDAGDTVTYDIAVTNTGNVTLTGVVVSDPRLGGTLATIDLDPGQTVNVTGSYVIQQSDMDSWGDDSADGADGDIDNTATATAAGAGAGGTDLVATGSAEQDLGANPGIQIVKTGKVYDGDGNADADNQVDSATDEV